MNDDDTVLTIRETLAHILNEVYINTQIKSRTFNIAHRTATVSRFECVFTVCVSLVLSSFRPIRLGSMGKRLSEIWNRTSPRRVGIQAKQNNYIFDAYNGN